MKSIVELGGTVTHSKITVYLPKGVFSRYERTNRLPTSYDYLLSVDPFCNVDIKLAESKNNDAFVSIAANNVKSVINPTCNVSYKTYRLYSLTQWVMHGFICSSRYIKNKFNKYIGDRK